MLELMRDEDGQASVEYILMLSIVVAMVVSLIKKFIRPYLAKLADVASNQLESVLFNQANMHSLRIPRH